MNIVITEVVGSSPLVTLEKGQLLHDLILPLLLQGEEVHLDFAGIGVLSSPFLNMAIGRLLKDMPIDSLRDRLHFVNMSEENRSVLDKVLNNSNVYYNDPTTRLALDDALDSHSEEEF